MDNVRMESNPPGYHIFGWASSIFMDNFQAIFLGNFQAVVARLMLGIDDEWRIRLVPGIPFPKTFSVKMVKKIYKICGTLFQAAGREPWGVGEGGGGRHGVCHPMIAGFHPEVKAILGQFCGNLEIA